MSCVNRGVRYIALSHEGSHEGMDGIACHARSGSPFILKPTCRAQSVQIWLLWAAEAHLSTLKHAFSALPISDKSTLRGPQRHEDRSTSMEFMSSSTMEPTSVVILADQKRRTRADRRCRSRDTISGHMSDHEEAHGGWRRTG